MERVKTLIEKLKQQSDSGATAGAMLTTTQMLQAELARLESNGEKKIQRDGVIILMPSVTIKAAEPDGEYSSAFEPKKAEEEKIVEVLQVDEEEIENELAEIKKHAQAMHSMSHAPQMDVDFDPLEDVPTLAHQDPDAGSGGVLQGKIEYPEITPQEESLNDKLKELRTELSESLTATPIKDLRKAIGVNDRFVFINELFRGDEAMYERSIKTIQGFSIYAEAEFWIRRELRLKLGWSNSDPLVKQFDDLVKRRFM